MIVNSIKDNPEIRTYQYNAYLEAILYNHHDYKEWLYSNYIQVVYLPEEQCNVSLDYEAPTIYGGCSLIEYQDFAIKDNKSLFLESINDNLQKGKYIYLFLDEYYVPERSSFGKYHFVHDILIYGVDKQSKTYLVIGYNSEFEFVKSQIDFEACYQGFVNNEDHIYIKAVALKRDTFTMKEEVLKIMLEDYLYGRNSKEHLDLYIDMSTYCPPFFDCRKQLSSSFGVKVYDQYIKDIIECAEQNLEIDYRISYLLYEHHKLMRNRVLYLQDKGVIKKDLKLVQTADDIIRRTKQLVNISLKSLYVKEKKVLCERLIEILVFLEKIDCKFISDIIHLWNH